MQVYIFMCNDKGSTWAYSTPGYGAALVPAHLRLMREAACAQGEDARTRNTTEVRPGSSYSPHRSTNALLIGRPVDSMRVPVVGGRGRQGVGAGRQLRAWVDRGFPPAQPTLHTRH